MSKIYVIMKIVDLGGRPMLACSELAKAEALCDEMNRSDTEEHIKSLIKNCGYSEEEAMRRARRNQFYIEVIELKD